MAAYHFKVENLFKVSARVAGEECERLAASPEGLSPSSLLDASRSPNAPLHDCFEWDDDKAAELYRLKQAGDLIRNIVIEREEGHERAFVNVRPAPVGAYHSIERVLDSDEWRASLLQSAKRDAELFIDKYRRLSEAADACQVLRELLEA